ncbi:MAG: 5'/3'-nucleotidase SurE [Elusimicrobia bacterium]|nr:5'/3'-nucleotidase SurE [Elusimicrobiota bacterium]
MPKRKILITNDDGIYGPGLKALERALAKFADVFVIVPDQERSTASHSLTLHKPLRVRQISKRTYILNGTPADCARFGLLHLLSGRMDLVVSGINSGLNLGEDVIYSGTVAAAVEATMIGVPAIAVSRTPEANPAAFSGAAEIAARVAKGVLRHGLPEGITLNVNVPSGKRNGTSGIKGCRVTHLGHRLYGKKVTMRSDPRGHRYYWLLAKNVQGVPTPGSDVESFEQGYATITPIGLDWTAVQYLADLKKWKI